MMRDSHTPIQVDIPGPKCLPPGLSLKKTIFGENIGYEVRAVSHFLMVYCPRRVPAKRPEPEEATLIPSRKENVSYRRTVGMRKFSRFDETRRARWSRLIFSMYAWLSSLANWVSQRVAFAELCHDFIPSYKVSIFISEYLVAHQLSDFF